MDLRSLPQNTCPLCRQPELDLTSSPWHCRSCGCRLEFDTTTRRSRIVHFPDEYAALEGAVGSGWLSRREMFERVDAAQKAQADAEATLSQTRWLGPVIIVTLTLLVMCIILGAIASALVISPSLARTRRTISVAYQPTATATVTATIAPSTTAVPLAAGSSPLTTTEAVSTPTLPATLVVTATAAPTPPLAMTPTLRTAAVTALPPTLPSSTSPLPVPEATRPPTFTPPPATLAPTVAAVPTLTSTPGVTSTPTMSSQLNSPVVTPTVTAGVPTQPPPGSVVTSTTAPTVTVTTVPLGAVIFQGTIQVRTIQVVGTGPNQADEYVELVNIGSQQVNLDGWSLKAIRSADNTILDTYLFGNGAIIAAGQTCRIYTNLLTAPDNCGFSGGFANDQPIWPDNGGARASLVNQGNVEQARYTY